MAKDKKQVAGKKMTPGKAEILARQAAAKAAKDLKVKAKLAAKAAEKANSAPPAVKRKVVPQQAVSAEVLHQRTIARLKAETFRWQDAVDGVLGQYFIGHGGAEAKGVEIEVREKIGRNGRLMPVFEDLGTGIFVSRQWLFYPEGVVPNYIEGDAGIHQKWLWEFLRLCLAVQIEDAKVRYNAQWESKPKKQEIQQPQAVVDQTQTAARLSEAIQRSNARRGASTDLRAFAAGVFGKYDFSVDSTQAVLELGKNADGVVIRMCWLDASHELAKAGCHKDMTVTPFNLSVGLRPAWEWIKGAVYIRTGTVCMKDPKAPAAVDQVAKAKLTLVGGTDMVLVAAECLPNKAA